MKLDRAGLDYLIEQAAQVGFKAASCTTVEEYVYAPEVTIRFVQTHEPKVEDAPLFKERSSAVDIRQTGVTEGQAAEIIEKSKDKMRTLDEV